MQSLSPGKRVSIIGGLIVAVLCLIISTGCYKTVVVSDTQPVQLAQDVPGVKIRAFDANGDLVEGTNRVTLRNGQWVVTRHISTQPVK